MCTNCALLLSIKNISANYELASPSVSDIKKQGYINFELHAISAFSIGASPFFTVVTNNTRDHHNIDDKSSTTNKSVLKIFV